MLLADFGGRDYGILSKSMQVYFVGLFIRQLGLIDLQTVKQNII